MATKRNSEQTINYECVAFCYTNIVVDFDLLHMNPTDLDSTGPGLAYP